MTVEQFGGESLWLGQHSEENERADVLCLGRHSKADLENGGKLQNHDDGICW